MKSHVLINAPERQSHLQRGVYSTLTLLAWGVYLYLILPLLTLLLWALGLRNSYLQLWLPDAGPAAPALLVTLPVLGLTCAALLIGWAEWNRARFQNHERRGQAEDADDAEIAAVLEVTPTLADALRHSRVATLVMDEDARLQGVHTLEAVKNSDPWVARQVAANLPLRVEREDEPT
ncbi:MAG: poly-beta-1,6-N-acetyl-D-glucosamine biosynthesis protein PgaD [Pseudomonadota bacterium]|nr:poly-beta-1,6-N-acetyl-D-glucosamine biosynthesis protein PgaD [Pseudomonadota bacterium]